MKKFILLCLAPVLLLAACNKTQMKSIKGAAEDNDFTTQIGDYQFNVSSLAAPAYLLISFAIENESEKDATFKFRNNYLVVEDGRERYPITFVKEFGGPDPLRVAVKENELTVAADSSDVIVAETTELNRSILGGWSVTLHTEINGKYSFTISNLCLDLR